MDLKKDLEVERELKQAMAKQLEKAKEDLKMFKMSTITSLQRKKSNVLEDKENRF